MEAQVNTGNIPCKVAALIESSSQRNSNLDGITSVHVLNEDTTRQMDVASAPKVGFGDINNNEDHFLQLSPVGRTTNNYPDNKKGEFLSNLIFFWNWNRS